ncbi:MAG: PadR family transcriptional regulator [Lachnospiraceae bacterium]|nr:PadR family transcriptional regulator [Lachnospiraceae bacterium]
MSERNTFYKGYVELLVLRFLSEDDYYGLQLVKKIKEESNGLINLSVGTLYPTLYKLIEKKYITDYKVQTGERMIKVFYHIENLGRERLDRLIKDYNELTIIMNNIIGH